MLSNESHTYISSSPTCVQVGPIQAATAVTVDLTWTGTSKQSRDFQNLDQVSKRIKGLCG
jgi:hypothetical protein